MGLLNIVAALWIVLRTAVASPTDTRYAAKQRDNEHHPITPRVFIIDMVS